MNHRDQSVWRIIGSFLAIAITLALYPKPSTAEDEFTLRIFGNAGELTVTFTGVEPLSNGFHYEGWAIIDGAAVGTGKFNIGSNGEIVDLAGNAITDGAFNVAADLGAATAIVLTIEPAGDVDANPSDTHYLAGTVENGAASLTTDHPAALGSDFLSAIGKYILATPTNGENTDENSGVWFLELAANTVALSIEGLDPLANGYHYEGWAIIGGAPYTTGKFNVDENGDYVDLAGNVIANGYFKTDLDLNAATDFVLSIEPPDDSDPAPAATKYVGGGFSAGTAALNTTHPATLGNDFIDATGRYILATPTNGAETDENSGIWFLDPTSNVLQLSASGLEALNDGFHYEGWAIVEGAPVATGKFNIDADGAIVDLDGNLVPNGEFIVSTDISSATDVVITIEPAGDNDAVPAATKYLGGAVTEGAASLTTSHPAALNSDFTDATGTYILATPTDGEGNNENSGIWFLDPSSGSPVAGLALAELPEGWAYEGWVVLDGQPVTTGVFTDVAAADNGAPFSGANPGPPFPGEDFLQNAPDGLTFPTDLAGATAVISIEPSPDDSPAPFTLKPLVGGVPSDATDHTPYAMSNNAGGFPTMTATIKQPARGLNLPVLPAGWKYEGWVVIDGTPVTTGTFNDLSVADDAAPYSGAESGPPFPGEDFLQNAPDGLTFPTDLAGTTAVISIEPYPDDSSAPFTLKPLVGAVPSDAVDHTVYDMGNNAAVFPTGTATIMVSPAAGLGLPTLPAGWNYEGWVVINGVPVTTGTFLASDAADDSAPFSGANPGPPFPGEDFLQNAPDGLTFPVDLAGGTAVISIEPSPDDSPAPFTLKPLVGAIPSDATDHFIYAMDNNAAGFPSGSATIDAATSVGENGGLPQEFGLMQNYPNPFNPSTVIRFNLPESEKVTLKVYNAIGVEVFTLVEDELQAGFHKITLDASNLPAGLYLYRLRAGDFTDVKKMLFVK